MSSIKNLDKLFSRVQKATHYSGGELNSFIKDPESVEEELPGVEQVLSEPRILLLLQPEEEGRKVPQLLRILFPVPVPLR